MSDSLKDVITSRTRILFVNFQKVVNKIKVKREILKNLRAGALFFHSVLRVKITAKSRSSF